MQGSKSPSHAEGGGLRCLNLTISRFSVDERRKACREQETAAAWELLGLFEGTQASLDGCY